MRNALLALTAICAAFAATPGAARDLPYCIKGCDFGGGAGDCSFSSLAQCQASASGRYASCGVNPIFAFGAQQVPTRRVPRGTIVY